MGVVGPFGFFALLLRCYKYSISLVRLALTVRHEVKMGETNLSFAGPIASQGGQVGFFDVVRVTWGLTARVSRRCSGA